jgi:hypothetical protein
VNTTPEGRPKSRTRKSRISEQGEEGTETDVSGAYNAVFLSVKHIGARTSLIVDPPNGRGLLHRRRTEERAFAEGCGFDPATRDNMTFGSALDDDPFR